MKFTKDFLKEEAADTEVLTELIDERRWVNVYRMVFEYQGKFYETVYEQGKTENQWVELYENDPDEIECPEVFKKEKTIIVYE